MNSACYDKRGVPKLQDLILFDLAKRDRFKDAFPDLMAKLAEQNPGLQTDNYQTCVVPFLPRNIVPFSVVDLSLIHI